jgi:hypothetical protein
MSSMMSERKYTDFSSDPANFINFCKGQTLTNGLQVKTGSCNGVGKVIFFSLKETG